MKKDNNKKVYYKIFKFSFILLFVIFITLYISQTAGYYEYANNQQMVLTEKQIEKFESDVKSGKNIDIEKYLKNTKKNYNTGFSKMGLKLSNIISDGVSKGVEGFFNFLIKFIDE